MTAVYIICGILLFFALVAFLRVSVRVAVGDTAEVDVKILFITVRLTPKKEKPVRISDFEIGKFRKRRLRTLKKERKKLLKKQKKEEKKKAEKESAEAAGKEKRSPVDTARFFWGIAKNVLPPVIGKFGKHIYVKVDALAVIVRGDEPDRTAVTFGYLAQSFAYVSELLNSVKKISYGKDCDGRYGVAVDFTGGRTSVDADITVGLRVWQVFSIAAAAIKNVPRGTVSAVRGGKKSKKKKKAEENITASAGEERSNGKQHERNDKVVA